MTKAMIHSSRGQSGVSLVEVLVAMVIVAVGLLGVSGMFLLSTRGATDAAARSVAAQAAYEITDKIRGNRQALATYLTPTWGASTVIPTAAAPAVDCFTVVCTRPQQALFDMIVWARSLTNASLGGIVQARASRLPQAQALICQDLTPDDGTPAAPACTAGATDPLVVKVWWSERAMNATEGAGAASLQRRYVLSFVP
ncbi:type IV pilus modification protein PilV [Niveibacterium sp.]|uniref:type IV pilus modification protein PilV n=1 Tax=Niveibacterium sp. TaxID=2017444 RepID=UPI0035B4DAE9